MKKEMSTKNHDRLILLGLTISALRKYRGMSQEQLAQRACVSCSLIRAVEAPGCARSLSLDAFYSIADALDIEPAKLLRAPAQLEHLLGPNI